MRRGTHLWLSVLASSSLLLLLRLVDSCRSGRSTGLGSLGLLSSEVCEGETSVASLGLDGLARLLLLNLVGDTYIVVDGYETPGDQEDTKDGLAHPSCVAGGTPASRRSHAGSCAA